MTVSSTGDLPTPGDVSADSRNAMKAGGPEDVPGVELLRNLIRGTRTLQPLPTPPAVEEALRRLFPGKHPPLWIRDSFNLQAYYGGRVVACYQAKPRSEVAVLAVGHPEIARLLKGVTQEERDRITIRFPDPPPTPVTDVAEGED